MMHKDLLALAIIGLIGVFIHFALNAMEMPYLLRLPIFLLAGMWIGILIPPPKDPKR